MAEKKLLDQVRDVIRTKHYSYKTEKSYVHWILKFILFNKKRHPLDIGEVEVAAATQNQAFNAIVFLYKQVLYKELDIFPNIQWAKRPQRLPVVFTQSEVKEIMKHLSGREKIMASFLYGVGLRLTECLCLRIKDIDFERRQLCVRSGKGAKDRLTVLPEIKKSAVRLIA